MVDSSGRHRSHHIAAVTSLILTVAAPSSASGFETTGAARALERLTQATATHAWSPPIVQQTGSGFSAAAAEPDNDCFGDPEGDTLLYSDPPRRSNEPRADILEHCARYGPSLSLAVDVERPTNPGSDRNWNGATFAAWFIDINDDQRGDFFVAYHLDQERQLIGEVKDIRRQGQEPVSCIGTATYTSEAFSVSDIGPECIGQARTVRVSPAMWYDTTPTEGADGEEHYDVSPDGQDPNDPSRFPGPTKGGEERPTRRLGGDDRIETAVLISKEQFPTGPVDVVFIARSDLFADAVTGGVLVNGPVLLVPQCGPVPEAVKAEIARLNPKRVIALGLQEAVCDEMLEQAADGRPTDRLGGQNRIGTSIQISQFRFPDGSVDVYLARSDLFADAVVGGILTRGPILLVPPCEGVPPNVEAEIDRLDPRRVVALGGEVAICDATLAQAADGRPTVRLQGATRIETAVAISQYEWRDAAPRVFLARDGRPTEPSTDDNLFADSAVGGILTTGPILLVPSCGILPEAVAGEISRLAPGEVIALGGTAAICPEMVDQAARH